MFHDDEKMIVFGFSRHDESYLVECRRTFILEDLSSTIKSAGVSCGCLKANFDNVWKYKLNMAFQTTIKEGKTHRMAVLYVWSCQFR